MDLYSYWRSYSVTFQDLKLVRFSYLQLIYVSNNLAVGQNQSNPQITFNFDDFKGSPYCPDNFADNLYCDQTDLDCKHRHYNSYCSHYQIFNFEDIGYLDQCWAEHTSYHFHHLTFYPKAMLFWPIIFFHTLTSNFLHQSFLALASYLFL